MNALANKQQQLLYKIPIIWQPLELFIKSRARWKPLAGVEVLEAFELLTRCFINKRQLYALETSPWLGVKITVVVKWNS